MKIRRMFRNCALPPAVAVGLMIVVGCSALSDERRPIEADPDHEISPTSTSESCAAGLRAFVTGLDDTLMVYPATLGSLSWLLERSFPLKGCAIPEVIAICERSKYFAGMSDDAAHYVISFNNVMPTPGVAYIISFAVDKKTGDTRNPSVRRRHARDGDQG